MFKHQLIQLKAGLEVLLVPLDSFSSVTALILGNTGSRYEDLDQQGIAHFFEHMVFKGSKNYPSAQVLAETLDSVGAEANAFTSKEYTGYYVKAASIHLPLALDILSDMILLPKLSSEEIEKEKGVIIEEMNMYLDMPMRDIGNLFDKLLFIDQSLGHDVIGTKKTVLSLKKQDFSDFLKRWYDLHNLTLVLAGDSKVLNKPELIDQLEKLFTQKAQSLDHSGSRVVTKDLFGQSPWLKKKVLVRNQATQQVHLMLGWSGLKRDDPQRYALSLLSVILGGNMSSRLFAEVREKRGLCYYVNAAPDFFRETGSLAVAAGIDPKRLDEALRVIIDECESLASGKKPVTAAELKKAQDFAIGSMILSFEDTKVVAEYFGLRQVLLRQVDPPEKMIEKLRAVKLSQIQTLAREIIQLDQLRIALIGPFKTSDLDKYVTKSNS